MAPYLLRSAVAILRRPTPPSTFLRRSPIDSSRFFASGGAVRVEPSKAYCVGCMRMESALEKHSENLYKLEKDIGVLLEHQRRFERSEQFHKRLSCVLIPGAIAFFVFGPDKKREPSTEGQSGV